MLINLKTSIFGTLGIVLMTTAVISGCSSDNESKSDFNDADVMFAQMMIPHHEQAIELADIALDPSVGATKDVTDIATAIKSAQDPEIAFMTAWLSDRNQSLTMDNDMDHSEMMSGMLTVEQIDDLSLLTGSEFDAAWAQAVIAHHEGAIEMAQDVIDGGQDAAIRELAGEIISAQEAEIEGLKTLAPANS